METSTPCFPELKQLLGALILAARRPLSVREIRRLLQETADGTGENPSPSSPPFANLKDCDIETAAEALSAELKSARLGFWVEEGPDGYRFKTDPLCGPWVRRLLETGRGQRLSRPALETLAIIAWRQPITRADIEAIRGVSVDHVLKLLLELQLVRIVGRSELPGRPLLYGTTTYFLEHFGLKDITELPRLEELARLDTVRRAREQEGESQLSPTEPAPESAVELNGKGPETVTEETQVSVSEPSLGRASENEPQGESVS